MIQISFTYSIFVNGEAYLVSVASSYFDRHLLLLLAAVTFKRPELNQLKFVAILHSIYSSRIQKKSACHEATSIAQVTRGSCALRFSDGVLVLFHLLLISLHHSICLRRIIVAVIVVGLFHLQRDKVYKTKRRRFVPSFFLKFLFVLVFHFNISVSIRKLRNGNSYSCRNRYTP